MKNQIEVVYVDGSAPDKFNVDGPDECDVRLEGAGGEVIICTTEGNIIRLNWSCIKSIRYCPAPKAKKDAKHELNFDGTLE
jgi:hypothetical protein